jgi:hypothetical protein
MKYMSIHDIIRTSNTQSMIDLDRLNEQQLEALSEDCEDYLVHRYIPLTSHSHHSIINQALKEGYQLEKFDRIIIQKS